MRFGQFYCLTVFVTCILISNSPVSSDEEVLNLKNKKLNKDRSTSSSSGEWHDEDDSDSAESLKLSGSESSSSTSDETRHKYSKERLSWRQWHRQCTPCPEDMVKKWKDRSIRWICGAYQQARRSFKSVCMMHYRNCQDGTMFIKISDYRCQNNTEHGDHFFYDYHVVLSDDSDSDTSRLSESDSSSDSVQFD